MTMEAFRLATGGGATHVPFPEIAASTTAMLGGHIDMMIDAVFTAHQYFKDGRIRPLAAPMPVRDPLLPEIPTFVPAGTPRPIVDRLNAEIIKAVNKPEVRQKLEGLNVVTSTPEEAQKLIRDEYYYWGDIIKRADIKVD
jgi:tripartite-type tricarboxylate transporter receptor subunit TctC